MIQNKLIKNLSICLLLVVLMSTFVSAGFLDWFVGLFGNSATGYISAAPSPNQCLNHEDIKSKIESVNAKLDILIGDNIEEEDVEAEPQEDGEEEREEDEAPELPDIRELGGPCDSHGVCDDDLFCLKYPELKDVVDGVCMVYEKNCDSDADCVVCTVDGVCSTSFTCSESELCSWGVE